MTSRQEHRERIQDALQQTETVDIIEAACLVLETYYTDTDLAEYPELIKPKMFRLRKALEGIFGHELPFAGEEDD